eukprot:8092057-Pyramimonas_sp.AAC.1
MGSTRNNLGSRRSFKGVALGSFRGHRRALTCHLEVIERSPGSSETMWVVMMALSWRPEAILEPSGHASRIGDGGSRIEH